MLHVPPELEPAGFYLLHPLANSLCFGRGEHVISVNHALGFDKEPVGPWAECHEIPFPEIKTLDNLARDDYLPPLPNPPDPLSTRACFHCHAFRLADCGIMSSKPHGTVFDSTAITCQLGKDR
jgi:hypothetical protein